MLQLQSREHQMYDVTVPEMKIFWGPGDAYRCCQEK